MIAAMSLLGSMFLSSTANGIAVFMLFGAGLAAGLLGQIGDALAVQTLEDVAKVSSWRFRSRRSTRLGCTGSRRTRAASPA